MDDLESQSRHDSLRQSEGGGGIASKYQELFIRAKMQCLLMNHRKIRGNIKKLKCHVTKETHHN